MKGRLLLAFHALFQTQPHVRSAVRGFWCTWMVNTACERELVALASVGCCVRLALPRCNIWMRSWAFRGRWTLRPATTTPVVGCGRRCQVWVGEQSLSFPGACRSLGGFSGIISARCETHLCLHPREWQGTGRSGPRGREWSRCRPRGTTARPRKKLRLCGSRFPGKAPAGCRRRSRKLPKGNMKMQGGAMTWNAALRSKALDRRSDKLGIEKRT